MSRTLARMHFLALVPLLMPGAASCQPAANAPTFDIADVHVSPRADWVKNTTHTMQGGHLVGDRYQLRRATMLDLIRTAWNVDPDKVFGGPSWLDYDRFEVVAKTKPGTRPPAIRLMLQTLLVDRFHLVVKPDTQQVPGYILSRGKGSLNLNSPSDASAPTGCQNTARFGPGPRFNNFQCRNMTMADFASFLRGPVRLPVMDSTGLDGAWDIDLQYPMMALSSAGGGVTGITDALEKLGLKLEPGKVPQPVLSVESVNEQPSANLPGTAEALPSPPPPQFEVASIRLCNGQCNITSRPQFEPGGRVVADGMPPGGLISQAWRLSPFEQPAGWPKWLSASTAEHNIRIEAKAPAGVSPDEDNLNAMLRALMIDRYKMVVHYEDRPVDTDTLVAVKPKLAKADPANRTACARQNEIHPGEGAVVHLDCRNMTMAQFAEQIQAYEPDIFYPVLDGTGLAGAWDFTLTYDTFRTRSARAPDGDANGELADPTGSVSFVDAIQRQLGLKLEMHKRPEPVLVIDHMEEQPTEN